MSARRPRWTVAPGALALAAVLLLYPGVASPAAGSGRPSAGPAAGSGRPSAGPAAAAATGCPLKPSSKLPSGDAWAFTYGGPSVAGEGSRIGYTHGRGSWAGSGGGTICMSAEVAGAGKAQLVLDVSGGAKVSPRITRLGHLGVGLTLNVRLASGQAMCPAGTAGTAVIFASYYESHHDSVRLSFQAPCTGLDVAFHGASLKALIARNGGQVNSA